MQTLTQMYDNTSVRVSVNSDRTFSNFRLQQLARGAGSSLEGRSPHESTKGREEKASLDWLNVLTHGASPKEEKRETFKE